MRVERQAGTRPCRLVLECKEVLLKTEMSQQLALAEGGGAIAAGAPRALTGCHPTARGQRPNPRSLLHMRPTPRLRALSKIMEPTEPWAGVRGQAGWPVPAPLVTVQNVVCDLSPTAASTAGSSGSLDRRDADAEVE